MKVKQDYKDLGKYTPPLWWRVLLNVVGIVLFILIVSIDLDKIL